MTWKPVEERFAELVTAFEGRERVTVGNRAGFGSGTLQVDGRIFAMVSGGRLVFKVPANRVTELIEDRRGIAFDAGKGRPLKEWVALLADSDLDVLGLAEEARAFVAR